MGSTIIAAMVIVIKNWILSKIATEVLKILNLLVDPIVMEKMSNNNSVYNLEELILIPINQLEILLIKKSFCRCQKSFLSYKEIMIF